MTSHLVFRLLFLSSLLAMPIFAAGCDEKKSCKVGSTTRASGETWSCDCNTCGCDDGNVWSTLIACDVDAGTGP